MTSQSTRTLILSLAMLLCFGLLLFCSGCEVQYLDQPPDGRGVRNRSTPSPVVEPETPLPSNPALTAKVKTAFGSNHKAAVDFYGLYLAAAEVTSAPQYATKPADLLDGLETGRELLQHPHGEFPRLVEAVTEQLAPLKTNEPLTEQSRATWRTELLELASACREAAR